MLFPLADLSPTAPIDAETWWRKKLQAYFTVPMVASDSEQ
jgi:hypothetical protein